MREEILPDTWTPSYEKNNAPPKVWHRGVAGVLTLHVHRWLNAPGWYVSSRELNWTNERLLNEGEEDIDVELAKKRALKKVRKEVYALWKAAKLISPKKKHGKRTKAN